MIRIRANQATVAGAMVGALAGFFFAKGWVLPGILALGLSGILDAVDGTLARTFETASAWGGILDLTLDRVVEAAVLIGLMWARPYLQLAGTFVLATWYVNITAFMATGAALEAGDKLIHYPPGIVERSEAFIFFILVALVPGWGVVLCCLYAVLEIATALQRLAYARYYLAAANR